VSVSSSSSSTPQQLHEYFLRRLGGFSRRKGYPFDGLKKTLIWLKKKNWGLLEKDFSDWRKNWDFFG